MYTDSELRTHTESLGTNAATRPASLIVRALGSLVGRWGFKVVSIESLIENYILEHRLVNGSHLPAEGELAEQLGCEEKALARALRVAENKLKVTRDEKGWVVASSPVVDYHAFSFTKSAETHERKLTTDVLEKEVRLPLSDEDPFGPVERAAQKALGLAEDAPFMVIVRFRLLDGEPSALHRVYLDPSKFKPDFLDVHDFGKESLIDIYAQNGYKTFARDTVLAARMANVYEDGLLKQKYKSEEHKSQNYIPRPRWEVVLDAEQHLYAQDTGGNRFVLEFLKASYFENWKYEIKNRPAP